MCPDWEWNLQPFGSQANIQFNPLSHQPGLMHHLKASSLIIKEPGLELRFRVTWECITSYFSPMLLRKGTEHPCGSLVWEKQVQGSIAAWCLVGSQPSSLGQELLFIHNSVTCSWAVLCHLVPWRAKPGCHVPLCGLGPGQECRLPGIPHWQQCKEMPRGGLTPAPWAGRGVAYPDMGVGGVLLAMASSPLSSSLPTALPPCF